MCANKLKKLGKKCKYEHKMYAVLSPLGIK